jgi:bifunctional non-homologous end joining protein LigD
MDRSTRASSPFGSTPAERDAYRVRPDLAAQVGFTEWTRDGKLRHPRFRGLRTDKAAFEVVRETR